MALSTAQLRTAWKDYECRADAMVEMPFGPDRIRVAAPTVEAWTALAGVLAHHGYDIRVHDTDSYNCRAITGGTGKSLHAYGIALDVNWTTNPYQPTPDRRPCRFSGKTTQAARAIDVKEARADTDMTRSMIEAVLAIKTKPGAGKQAAGVFAWGGDWQTVKDAMHFEICLAPEDIAQGIDWTTVAGGRAHADDLAAQAGAEATPAPTEAFRRAHALIEKWEGGFANHPSDPGGATNLGITRDTLARWRRRPVGVADVRDLTREEAVGIFYAWYWARMRCDALPLPLALMTYNAGVNCGPGRGARFLQRALNGQGKGLAVDGVIGPLTLAAAAGAEVDRAVADFASVHEAYYRSLVSLFPAFGRGWLNRLRDITKEAMAMAGEALPIPDPADPRPVPPPLDGAGDTVERLQGALAVLREAGLTRAVAITAIDRALGGPLLAGKKTLLAGGAYVALVLANQAGFFGGAVAPTATYDTLLQVIATFGGLSVVSKFERAIKAAGAVRGLLGGILAR